MQNDVFPVVRDENGRTAQRITCLSCGAHDQNTITTSGRAGNEMLVSYFRRRGWKVDLRRGATCSDCQKSNAAMLRKIQEKKRMETKDRAGVVTPTPAASSKVVEVYMVLDDAYDKAAKRYKPGWSDDRVAKETGAAINLVTERRARDFGPIPPPKPDPLPEVAILASPVLIELADALSTVKAAHEKLDIVADRIRRIAAVAADASAGRKA